MKCLKVVIVCGILAAGCGILFIYSGYYNVSAAVQDPAMLRWVYETTMDNSVSRHAKAIEVPALDDSTMIRTGFAHFHEMCEICHGAPGVKTSELAKGLNPDAPDLSESAEEMTAAELFWVTKNGVKMTGMPSWGKTHTDEKIWDMVAFMKTLPGMTAEDYRRLVRSTEMVENTELEESEI